MTMSDQIEFDWTYIKIGWQMSGDWPLSYALIFTVASYVVEI